MDPASVVVHGGRPERTPDAPVGPGVTFTSTYIAGGEHGYGRFGNPTWTAFEDVLGELEGGRALAFASGMGAASATIDLVRVGGRVVAPRNAYSGVLGLLDRQAAAGRLTVERVDIDDTDAVVAALAHADLLWAESPTNPALEVADLPALCAAARQAGVMVAVDNTFATPLLQKPLTLGADVVVHSATKLLSGHSDVMLGVAVTNTWYDELLAKRTDHGAIPGPMETWLALRGLRTLAVRFERAQSNASTLAARLAEHPGVTRVRYPGFGAVLSIEVDGNADRVGDRVRLWLHATSLGGVESMLERRRRWPAESPSIPENLIRLSVGIEHVEDLWDDLIQALG